MFDVAIGEADLEKCTIVIRHYEEHNSTNVTTLLIQIGIRWWGAHDIKSSELKSQQKELPIKMCIKTKNEMKKNIKWNQSNIIRIFAVAYIVNRFFF